VNGQKSKYLLEVRHQKAGKNRDMKIAGILSEFDTVQIFRNARPMLTVIHSVSYINFFKLFISNNNYIRFYKLIGCNSV
jgi:hypothetical protein